METVKRKKMGNKNSRLSQRKGLRGKKKRDGTNSRTALTISKKKKCTHIRKAFSINEREAHRKSTFQTHA